MKSKVTHACIILFFSLMSIAQNSNMPYLDQNYNCITSQKADQYIKDFHINVKSFGGKELCKNTVDTKKLFNDLQIIENGKFNSTSSNKMIQGFVDSKNYYGWMKSQTFGIKRADNVPTATAYNQFGFFTMQDGWSQSSTLGRVGVVIHEARHTAGFRHIICNQGTYQNTTVQGCDVNYNYGGSHAVEMEYYARVAVQGLNFHPVYKKMARLMAMARANIFFNTPILKRSEAVLLLPEKQTSVTTAEMFFQNNWTQKEIPLMAGDLKRTSAGAVIFDGKNALAIDLYANSGYVDPVKDVYSYYKMSDVQVKDFEEFDQGSKRYVVKLTTKNEFSFYDFGQGQWGVSKKLPFKGLRFVKNFTGALPQDLGIVSDQGDIYLINAEKQSLTFTGQKWDFNILNIALNGNQKLALKTSGKVFDVTTGQLWSKPNEVYKSLINVPLYDAFTVAK